MYFRITFIKIFLLLALDGAFSNDLHHEHPVIVSSFLRESAVKSPAMTTITRDSTDFCQVRVDFVDFYVGETDANGDCNEGFSVYGHNNTNNVPKIICGFNDEQHVYLNFAGDNPITILILFDDSTGIDSWHFKFSQIACDDQENSAPFLSCLQYYKEYSGTVKSFNFRNIDIPADPPVNYQLSNLDYTVCVGSPSTNYNKITWTKGIGTSNYYFVLTESIELYPTSVAGTIYAAKFANECLTNTSDYVYIFNGEFPNKDGDTSYEYLFCGVGFPSSVSTGFLDDQIASLDVYTNSYENSREGSVGFSLSYYFT